MTIAKLVLLIVAGGKTVAVVDSGGTIQIDFTPLANRSYQISGDLDAKYLGWSFAGIGGAVECSSSWFMTDTKWQTLALSGQPGSLFITNKIDGYMTFSSLTIAPV